MHLPQTISSPSPARLAVLLALAGLPGSLAAQTRTTAQPISALMLSDIHFDPFHDPAKAQALDAGPIAQWPAILSAPESADRAARFDALQQTCKGKGIDTPYALLTDALRAAHRQSPQARFATVSGDLVVHKFDCRYHTLLPGKTPADYSAFVVKTIAFVAAELHRGLPGMPIYLALGNNDSGCGDYQLDPRSQFFAAVAPLFAADLGAALPSAQRKSMLDDFAADGSYSVTMAPPMRNTRLIVLDNTFLSTRAADCTGKPDPAAADAELAWLRHQLDQAKQAGQRVWVLGHLPPGIDLYSTAVNAQNVCAGVAPTTYVNSNAMAETLVANADAIHLAIFAHTHMDELRLLTPETGSGAGVALKMVPSITPINGNNPTFTVARIDPATADMTDYSVYARAYSAGTSGPWTRQYDFDEAYHQPNFTPLSLQHLLADFKADPQAATPASRTYLGNYRSGDSGLQLTPLWPAYVCVLSHTGTQAFRNCVCNK